MLHRVRTKLRRMFAVRVARRELRLCAPYPLVSFTFDDAPRSAFCAGTRILEAQGIRGTFYLSLGLMGTNSELGPIGNADDVRQAAQAGHELGCHTYAHLDAWSTPVREYVESVERNRQCLATMLPGYRFTSFAYPKNGATLSAKRAIASRFDSCRGGGQAGNSGVADLNHLQACFIDRRAGMDMSRLQNLIDFNSRRRGWLIFAAHDISDDAGDFSCSPARLETLVRACLDSGAQVLPVSAALARLRATSMSESASERH
jgi:hypothetical protein